MKVKDAIILLLDCKMDDDVVVQINHGEGYTHHDLLIQTSGHPGHSGPVIHHGMQVEYDVCTHESTTPKITGLECDHCGERL